MMYIVYTHDISKDFSLSDKLTVKIYDVLLAMKMCIFRVLPEINLHIPSFLF